jgi:hypothetical protein
MRRVTDRAVLCCRWVLISERALFFAMTPVANLVDRWFFQVSCRLAVTIVAIRANHFAFLDGMVGWHRVLRVNLGMATVTNVWLVDRHGYPRWPRNVRVRDAHSLLHMGGRVRIVAVGAGHAVLTVRRGVPSHRGRAFVTFETEIGACFLTNFSVWIMAGVAREPIGTHHLVRTGHPFKLFHAAMTAITNLRSDGTQEIRCGPNGLGIERGQSFFLKIRDLFTNWLVPIDCDLDRKRSRRDVVMGGVAVGTGNALVGVRRSSPGSIRFALVLLVALQTDFGSLGFL